MITTDLPRVFRFRRELRVDKTEGEGEGKSGSCIRSPLSKGYAIPILSKPLLEDCASSRGCPFFFFLFQPCVTRLFSRIPSIQRARIICGRDEIRTK